MTYLDPGAIASIVLTCNGVPFILFVVLVFTVWRRKKLEAATRRLSLPFVEPAPRFVVRKGQLMPAKRGSSLSRVSRRISRFLSGVADLKEIELANRASAAVSMHHAYIAQANRQSDLEHGLQHFTVLHPPRRDYRHGTRNKNCRQEQNHGNQRIESDFSQIVPDQAPAMADAHTSRRNLRIKDDVNDFSAAPIDFAHEVWGLMRMSSPSPVPEMDEAQASRRNQCIKDDDDDLDSSPIYSAMVHTSRPTEDDLPELMRMISPPPIPEMAEAQTSRPHREPVESMEVEDGASVTSSFKNRRREIHESMKHASQLSALPLPDPAVLADDRNGRSFLDSPSDEMLAAIGGKRNEYSPLRSKYYLRPLSWLPRFPEPEPRRSNLPLAPRLWGHTDLERETIIADLALRDMIDVAAYEKAQAEAARVQAGAPPELDEVEAAATTGPRWG